MNNDNKVEINIRDTSNKFYLSDQDIVYLRNRNGDFELSDDGKYGYPTEIDPMWGGLAKEHVEEALSYQKRRYGNSTQP